MRQVLLFLVFRQRNNGSERARSLTRMTQAIHSRVTFKSTFEPVEDYSTSLPNIRSFIQLYLLIGPVSRTPLSAALGGNRGKAPLGSLVIKTELLETVHQVIQPLPLLVDDFPVVGQGVKQCLSLWHKQAPADGNEKRITRECFD